MKYRKIVQGSFLTRPNRFIAHVSVDGNIEVCHVKHTGRCRELLLPESTVYLEESDNPARKTKYDLVAVKKGEILVNMDSGAPNKVVGEWLKSGHCPLFAADEERKIKPEYKYGNSRIDFYGEAGTRKILMEVKGVTLEENGVARFPDAPSERAVKHVKELEKAVSEGYECYVMFVVQMKGVSCFTPNKDTQPEFCQVLRQAEKAGVKVLAYDCQVREDELLLSEPVEVCL
ncbi:MAG: DNA/RNA nuclease SfsA [Lachnospiraceae bacterium]|nr:DNA/RNA nuclease SfsA [Lachnospiraceae bacterium]